MKDEARRFPLAWPMNWKRTPPGDRRKADFRRHTTEQVTVGGQPSTIRRARPVNISESIDRLEAEMGRLGGSAPILSTNLPLSLRGLPLGNQGEPRDPGVAFYITLDHKELVFACDKWERVADNIAAIAQHIDALRRIDRYGVGRLEQAFAGYAALPQSTEDWRVVLGVGDYATLAQVDAAFLEKARTAHPDAGGSHEDMARLTAARDLARSVLRR